MQLIVVSISGGFMKKGYMCFVGVALLSGLVFGKDEKPPVKEEAKAQPPAPKVSVPKSKFTVDEDLLVMFFNEPEEHFVKARNSLARKDVKETTTELQKSIAFLKLEMLRANDENEKAIKYAISDIEKLIAEMEKTTISVNIRKLAESMKQDAQKASGDSAKALQVSSAELQKLADQMEDSAPQLSSPETLDPVIAKTHLVLVKHHLSKARDFWNRKDVKRSGNDLDATAEHLARTYQWMNKEADGATKSAFKDTRAASLKMIQGTAIGGDEFNKLVDLITKEVERVFKIMEPAKK